MAELYAHIKQAQGNDIEQRTQSLKTHSSNVGELAAQFATEFGCGDIARVMGLLHDKGKEQVEWQKYIQGVTGYNKEYAHVKQGPNHAFVGALLARKQYPALASLLAYPILGHHAGLYDYFDYDEIIRSKSIPFDINTSELDIALSAQKFESAKTYEYNHIIRMLFSCLVDADRLDTEAFTNPEHAVLRGGKKTLIELAPLLEDYLAKLQNKVEKEHKEKLIVNVVRSQVQEVCRKKSACEPGFYSLTVPTGGGKTLSSLVWAMSHAICHNKKRIIIAIPYTSIIVQTAQTLRTIFGEKNVLEHHSNVSFESLCDKDDKDEDKLALQMKLATENWDYPIIVTTNVQLFESMYSSKPTPCRKLHNLSNSVLILDEVQTLPTDFLQPIVNALKTYQRLFGMSVLFTTASQPVLEGKHQGTLPRITLDGIDKITEIIPEGFNLHDKLRRVNLHFDDSQSSYEEIAERIAQYDRVLCIVNTRKAALEIYKRLPKEEHSLTLHLSRMMCQLHIRETIEQIKAALSGQQHKVIRVVATQLIEAGVDIDFPIVFRQEAGLDSIVQSAGRCNREGAHDKGNTVIFMLEGMRLRGTLNRANEARKDIMDVVDDKMSPVAIFKYFSKLYHRTPTFDKTNEDGYNMYEMLEESMDDMQIAGKSIPSIDFRFKMASNSFHLIDDDSVGVVVQYATEKEIREGYTPHIEFLIEELKNNKLSYKLIKELGAYMINIKKSDYDELKGYLCEYNGVYVLDNHYSYMYSQEVGLTKPIDEILIK